MCRQTDGRTDRSGKTISRIRVLRNKNTEYYTETSYVLKTPSRCCSAGAGCYLVKHCPILVIFGIRIPEGRWLKMMLSGP